MEADDMGTIVDSAAKKKKIRQRTLISYYIEFIIIKEGRAKTKIIMKERLQ